EAHTNGRQGGGDVVQVGEGLVRQVRVGLVRDGQAAHLGTPCGAPPGSSAGSDGTVVSQAPSWGGSSSDRVIERVLSSHSKRNSKASTWRRASLMRGPQV